MNIGFHFCHKNSRTIIFEKERRRLIEHWEYQPRHGAGSFRGTEEDTLAALKESGCGDVYGPGGSHLSARCEKCERQEFEESCRRRIEIVAPIKKEEMMGPWAEAIKGVREIYEIPCPGLVRLKGKAHIDAPAGRGYTWIPVTVSAGTPESPDGRRPRTSSAVEHESPVVFLQKEDIVEMIEEEER